MARIYKNVFISCLTMDDVTVPIFLRLGARLKTFRAGDSKQPVGSIQNITIQNIKANATWPVGIVLSGIPGHVIENVTLTNIQIHLPGGGTEADAALKLEEKESAYPEIFMFAKIFPAAGLFARHVKGMNVSDIKLDLAAADARPLIQVEDGVNLTFADWKVSGNTDAGFRVQFDSVHKAMFTGFTKSPPKILGQANSEITIGSP